jgi:diadenosine tetraphosphate (Ap4A) HIT family hydrolase
MHWHCRMLMRKSRNGDQYKPMILTAMPCPFCCLPQERIVLQNDLALVIRDGYPVSPGHTLIIPKRHIGSFFEATAAERESLLHLLDEAKATLDAEFHPAGHNIGINDGAAAGQTVPHLHIHLIPRYAGDSADPRGGVRWIFPNKAKYWP